MPLRPARRIDSDNRSVSKSTYKKDNRDYRGPTKKKKYYDPKIGRFVSTPPVTTKKKATTPTRAPQKHTGNTHPRGPALSVAASQQKTAVPVITEKIKREYVRGSTAYRRAETKVSDRIPDLNRISQAGSRFAGKHPVIAGKIYSAFESAHKRTERVGTPTQRQALAGYTFGSYDSIQKRPIKTTAMFGVGLASPAAIKTVGKVGRAFGAGKMAARMAKAAELGIIGMYGYKTTKHIMSAPNSYEAGRRAAEAMYTEILPMGVGGYVGTKAIIKGKPTTPKEELELPKNRVSIDKPVTQKTVNPNISKIKQTDIVINKNIQKVVTETNKLNKKTITQKQRSAVNDRVSEMRDVVYAQVRKKWKYENELYKKLNLEMKRFEKQGKKPPKWMKDLYADLKVDIRKGGRTKKAAQEEVDKIINKRLLKEKIDINAISHPKSTKTDKLKYIKKLKAKIKAENAKLSPNESKIKTWEQQIRRIQSKKYRTIDEAIGNSGRVETRLKKTVDKSTVSKYEDQTFTKRFTQKQHELQKLFDDISMEEKLALKRLKSKNRVSKIKAVERELAREKSKSSPDAKNIKMWKAEIKRLMMDTEARVTLRPPGVKQVTKVRNIYRNVKPQTTSNGLKRYYRNVDTFKNNVEYQNNVMKQWEKTIDKWNSRTYYNTQTGKQITSTQKKQIINGVINALLQHRATTSLGIIRLLSPIQSRIYATLDQKHELKQMVDELLDTQLKEIFDVNRIRNKRKGTKKASLANRKQPKKKASAREQNTRKKEITKTGATRRTKAKVAEIPKVYLPDKKKKKIAAKRTVTKVYTPYQIVNQMTGIAELFG